MVQHTGVPVPVDLLAMETNITGSGRPKLEGDLKCLYAVSIYDMFFKYGYRNGP